jgi:hypothetical protein
VTDAPQEAQRLLALAVKHAKEHKTAKALYEAVSKKYGIDKTWPAWKGLANRHPEIRHEIKRLLLETPEPTVTTVEGVRANEWPDEDEVWNQLVNTWQKRSDLERRRRSQKVVISDGPFCLVHFSDIHAGAEGTDYPRLLADIEIVQSMPATRTTLIGDLVDNFILGRMRAIRDNGAIDITAEWVTAKRIIEMLGPSLLFVVSGNHDLWTKIAAGVDYLRSAVTAINPGVIYDEHEIKVDLVVGGVSFPGKLRHSWKGNSQWNDLHAIEKDGKLTNDFAWGVGGHTHRSGLYSTFNVSGRTAVAILVGPYKRYDDYGRQLGAIQHNEATAIAQVFDHETKSMVMFDNLELAAKFMDTLY